jgi:hypothetical protein
MKPPAVVPRAHVELKYFYRQLVEYAADFLRSKSRRKREPSGILRELIPRGPIEGALIEVRYRRPRRGQPDRPGRFFTNPNYVAAAIAASCVEDWRGSDSGSKRRGSYKVRLADGSMSNTRDAAARFAVELVNKHYAPLLPKRRGEASFDAVMELLQRSRTKWPSG